MRNLLHRRDGTSGVSEPVNPWLGETTPVEQAGPAALSPLPARPFGPTIPQPATVSPPPLVERLPVRAAANPAPLWWLGVHGGAGESTLATLEPAWPAAGHAWPAPTPSGPVSVVLVARTHARGLRAAQAAATEWAAGLLPHVELLGLVLIPDTSARLPRQLREYAHLVAGAVARTWSLPWIEPWRLGHEPDVGNVPGQVRRLLADLRSLIPTPSASGTDHRKER